MYLLAIYCTINVKTSVSASLYIFEVPGIVGSSLGMVFPVANGGAVLVVLASDYG
jgi:hypothetical protein